MRLLATLMLVLAFALVRPLAGQAEGLAPCVEAPAAAAAVDMPCHEMMGHEMAGMHHEAPAKPQPAKSVHAACASACCASPALLPVAAIEPVMIRQPVLLLAAIEPALSPVPHAPDLRPPIA